MKRRIIAGCCALLLVIVAYNCLVIPRSSYLEEKHKNYDYDEDLPDDVTIYKKRPSYLSLLKKFERFISPSQVRGDEKVILFWTSWFKKPWWVRLGGPGLDLEGAKCPETRCVFTHDKSKLKEASAVLFQSQRITEEALPHIRSPDQRWVWVHVEPPTTSKKALNVVSPRKGRSHDISRYFNWTMTYHPDSDILEPYGALLPLTPSGNTDALSVPNITTVLPTGAVVATDPSYIKSLRPTLLDTSGVHFKRYQQLLMRSPSVEELMASTWTPNLQWDKANTYTWSFLATKRPRLVAWVSSHCPTESRREAYVRRLKKYVKVDAYGYCGNLRCGSKEDHRNERCWKYILARKYLFYLAFENSVCDAYVTEKLWRPLTYGLVPIVMGGANYSQFLPPNSYINALDYSPEGLAHLLMDLRASPDLYIKYHLWRVFWKATTRPPLCEICSKVHEDKTHSVQHNIGNWWSRIGSCDNPAHWPTEGT